MKALRSGYIEGCGKNGSGYTLLLDDSYEKSPLQMAVQMNEQFLPTSTELLWQGKSILSIVVSDFTFL